MSTITLAAAQFSATADPAENLKRIRGLADQALGRGAQLVVFPEAAMACFGSRLRELAEPLDGPFAAGVRDVAAQLGCWLVVGMFTPADDGRIRNTLLATDGREQHTYDKIHLYDAFGSQESRTVQAGVDIVTFNALGTTVGLATCYDVRFADQFTALGKAGARVVCLPASWGDGPGKAEQWLRLTTARAMDSQSFFVACDQAWVADQGTRPLGVGHSRILTPDGSPVAQAGTGEALLVASVDLDIVDHVRAQVPILGHTPSRRDVSGV